MADTIAFYDQDWVSTPFESGSGRVADYLACLQNPRMDAQTQDLLRRALGWIIDNICMTPEKGGYRHARE